jgi:hypothetical protein
MAQLRATEVEIHRGRRVRRGEWYRVTTYCDVDVDPVSRRRYRTLRAAERAVANAEVSGLHAEIDIYGEAK